MSIATAISALQSASADIASAIDAKGVTVPSGSGFNDYASLIGQISGGGGGGTPPVKRIQYLDTDGSNYLLAPVTYSSGNTYVINFGVQFLATTNNSGIGWNAGGALAVFSSYYGDGSGALSPNISVTTKVDATLTIGATNTAAVVVSSSNGATHVRSNSSLATYAGSTGYPIGCMTNTGGVVPFSCVSMRIYYVNISKNGETKFDAYPAVSTAATTNERGGSVPIGTVGLYDTITKTFYTNRGAGNDFTPGPDYS